MPKVPPKPHGHNPPATLSKAAAEQWRRLQFEFGITDAPGLLLLQTGLEAWDRMQEAQALIRRDGLVVPAANGGTRCHPAVSIERDSRVAFQRALRQLNLDIVPTRDGPGRPPNAFGA
jgi:P27 family predicted phage terminase small subunit